MQAYQTFSSAETQTLGAVIAEEVLIAGNSSKQSGATVIALKGDLGSGKTTFTQGFLRALGARARVTSPTFVLMKRFPLGPRARKKGFKNGYHLDAYRLTSAHEATPLGLREVFADPKAVVLIEWPERIRGRIPRGARSIRFRHGQAEGERLIVVS